MQSNRSLVRTLILGALILILVPLASFGRPQKQASRIESVPGELVVRLKQRRADKAAQVSTWNEVARRLGAKLTMKNAPKAELFATDSSFAVIRVSESQKARAIRALTADAAVAYAEPNFIYHASTLSPDAFSPNAFSPNDEHFGQLWGMSNTGQTDAAGQVGRSGADIHVESAWARGITGSRDIRVAVIDTGVDYRHPDLVGNIWTNPGEIAGDGIDNDGNGFIDDVHGWNFATQGEGGTAVVANDPWDDHYHGTHCAGTIGGNGNNGIGVAGVNWQVTIVPVKFLDYQGSGSLAGGVQAIQYATRLGVQVMSNSWGGGAFSQALYDAIAESRAKGILFVAAAGNDSNDNDRNPSYPASYALDNIVSVAATDNLDRVAKFSNYGQTRVHVAAPGVKIFSTVPERMGLYKTLSGTSMATPHVSGIAALLLSANPSQSYADLKRTLIATSDRTHSLSRKSVSGGRVNVENALNGTVPPAPSGPDESQWVDVAAQIESPHPYALNQVYSYPVSVPGARYLRVVFESIDVEEGFDWISVKQGNGDEIERITGTRSQAVSDYLEGDSATLVLESDQTVTQGGFRVAKLQAIY
jgi:thermitase